MKFCIGAGIIFFALLSGSLLFLSYYGFFKKITITKEPEGPFMMVYGTHTGDYKQSAVIMDRIYYSLLNDEKIETYKGFGLYYDIPGETPTDKLRCTAGCLLEKEDWDRAEKLQSTYKVQTMPPSNFIYCEFPYKGKVSVLMSIIKVYPALNNYFKQSGLERVPIMEVYDIPNKKIKYYAGVELKKSFFDKLLD